MMSQVTTTSTYLRSFVYQGGIGSIMQIAASRSQKVIAAIVGFFVRLVESCRFWKFQRVGMLE